MPPHSLGEFLSRDVLPAGQLGIGLGKPVHRGGITHDGQGFLKGLQILWSDKDRRRLAMNGSPPDQHHLVVASLLGDPVYDVTQHIFNGVFLQRADASSLAAQMARLLDLDLDRIVLWLFARAVEAAPFWPGMADLAETLYPSLP